MSAATTLPAPPARRVRRLWLPAGLVLLPVGVRALLAVAHRRDLGENAIFTLTLLFQAAVGVAVLGFGLWFFLLGGLGRKVRLAAAVLLAGAAAAFFAAVDRVEFDGQMTPRLYYRWDPTPEQQLAAHR